MDELKVVECYNDAVKFENDVNGWCCNGDYKIMSCEVISVNEPNNYGILYVAFLGKQYQI